MSSWCIVFIPAFLQAATSVSVKRGGPMDAEAYVEEPRFLCSSEVGCPLLEHSWGQVIAHDPSTGKSATFRDVMAGPGWAKEWNWGHHTPHVTHETGPSVAEVEEIMEEMKSFNAANTTLDRFYMSTGVNGVMSDNANADAKVKELWNIEPIVKKSEALVGTYASNAPDSAHTAGLLQILQLVS
eukprot:CAMPEP_0197641808 /NCGR_PEP_ID=MMETSP1338-20131121/15652_1 /TAXON_ID=43686 ORGANISM="Pelagodinium beii, Strain RCC1491" /NCGR_SAMPLE_ID=MMETSP1338 /ASSEMBLY_ACC=CAM_ASM_000754 /LENGTH=183 /DNA_ID=CAMNT_0043214841 /DNA_START=23 /DNA_END=571 /DNA_ORIENTATION=+